MAKYNEKPQETTGMPGGIPYIIGNELAERFSFYGMKAILVVFMTKHLLDASGDPPSMGEENAKGIYHLFTAAAYFFPIMGAILADVLWGKYKTILLISLMYCLGHGMLALMDVGPHFKLWGMEPFMYLGLLLIAIGAGGIKPCVSAHVGDQFGTQNKHLLTKVFNWFYFSINVGAATSTMLTPIFLNAEWGGPWLAFGVPGVLMAIATFLFWCGRKKFVHVPPAGWKAFKEETFSSDGKRAIRNLAPLFLIFIPVFWSIFDQTGSAWVLQADTMDRQFLGFNWLQSQIQAANPILILTLIPVFTYIVYPFVGKFVKVTPLRKIGFGLFLTGVAFGTSALIEERISGGLITDTEMVVKQEGAFAPPYALDGEPDARGIATTPVVWGMDEAPRPEVVIRLRERSAWTIDSVAINPAAGVGAPIDTEKQRTDDLSFEDYAAKQDGFDKKTPDEQQAAYELYLAERQLDRETHEAAEAQKKRYNAMTDAEQEEFASRIDTDAITTKVEVLYHAPGATELEDPSKPDSEIMAWTSLGTYDLAPENTLQELTFEPVEADFVKIRILGSNGGARAKLGEVRVLASGGSSELATKDGVWPDVAAIGHQPNIGWQFLAYVLLTAAEVLVSIVSLEFAYTQAPKKMKSFIMGIYFLGVSLGNLFTSGVNFVLEGMKEVDGSTPLDGAMYYWAFTGLAFVTAIAFVFYSKTYKGETYIQGEDEADVIEARAEAEGSDA